MRKRMLTLGLILGILLMCALPPLIGLIAAKPEGEDDLTIRLYRQATGEVEEMEFSEFLAGCTAACLDFSRDYPTQALYAITVAEECILLSTCGSCEHSPAHDADFCDTPDHGSPYLSRSDAVRLYGKERADALFGQIDRSVSELFGIGVCFGGELALTLMHESSDLLTEDASELWGVEIPYLRSVRSYEEAEVRVIEIEKSVAALLMQAGLDGKSADPVIVDRTASGRVRRVKLGDSEVGGQRFAEALMLPCANFTIEQTEESYVFTVRGSGSGVGLSRMGAVVLAEQGQDFEQILAAYYPGTRLTSIDVGALLAYGRKK